jgi:hypothetical protein
MSEQTPKKFSLTKAYSEVAQPPFEFDWNDQDFTLPHMGELDFRVRARLQDMDGATNVDDVKFLLTAVLGDEQGARFLNTNLPDRAILMLLKQWGEHSGVETGESEASNSSSNNTGTNSRPTSKPSTASTSPRASTARRAPRKAPSRPANSST